MSSTASIFFPSSLQGRPERVSFLLVAGSVALALVSIAASQILLAGAILGALYLWKRQGRAPGLPAMLLWSTLLLFLWTVAAVLASSGGLRAAPIKKFVLFSLLVIIPILARGAERILWIYRAVFAVAAVSALAGLVQFALNPHRSLLDRIKGFMSIWMTYSGLLMLVLVALVAYVAALGWRKHIWVIPLAVALAAALYLSQTRSAWLGATLGAAVILFLKRPRAILGLAALLLALYLVSPASIQQRLRSGWNPDDPNTRNRIELFGTTLRLIRDHPWLGVGQRVSLEAPKYRGSQEFPDWMYLHMHNNFLQIAAERGIPGLLLWAWFMAQLGWRAFLLFQSSRRCGTSEARDNSAASFIATAAIGGWAALLAAGLFEYNFGDSEILTLFLFMMSAPFALKSDE
jgi:putative inorganic carbon (hco3(-)) transporter